MPHATVVRRAEGSVLMLGARNRVAARWKRAASADPNDDQGPKERPLAGPRAPLKAALQPLAASGAPGRRVPPAVPVRPLAGEASPTPGNPRPRVPPRHTLRPVEPSRASNLERPIANFCWRAWRLSKDPSRNASRPEAYQQSVERLPQSGNGLARKAGPRSRARRSSRLPSNSHRPSSKRSGSTERKQRLHNLIRSPFGACERPSWRQHRVTRRPEISTESFVRNSTGE